MYVVYVPALETNQPSLTAALFIVHEDLYDSTRITTVTVETTMMQYEVCTRITTVTLETAIYEVCMWCMCRRLKQTIHITHCSAVYSPRGLLLLLLWYYFFVSNQCCTPKVFVVSTE